MSHLLVIALTSRTRYVCLPSEISFSFQERQRKNKKHGKGSDVFVSAEEFSEMLDRVGASGLKLSGSSALSNRDNAGKY
jgi:hypothetical protein